MAKLIQRYIPADPDEMNDQRAQWAHSSAEAFGRTTGECFNDFYGEQRTEILHQNIKDLIADIAHLCDREGLDFAGILNGAQMHYDAETDGTGKQFENVQVQVRRVEPEHPQTDEHLAACVSCMYRHDSKLAD